MTREGLHYPQRRELARRVSSGLVVTLWWDEQSSEVAVSVSDRGRGAFQLIVDGRHALHAFYHPYAVAAVCRHEVTEVAG
ncbi:hypothetical protein GCM10009798_40290 [Nocardioides panacihumi]|uniref:KTSC domain-containing protein n=1 Tax=Nocardioides panacihumi TaxID=400774 RepID=A0ABN2RU54_9ACTN